MSRLWIVCTSLIALYGTLARADGPADNNPTTVRRVPKLGIVVSPEVTKELTAKLEEIEAKIKGLDAKKVEPLLPDVEVLHKAVHDALVYQEFFTEQEIAKARELLDLAQVRLKALANNEAEWPKATGLQVRGYRSKIDGSVQPYGLVIPSGLAPGRGYRLDVWFHGRGELLSEVNFLDERRKRVGEFSPPGTIVLHPYGRYCNANKFAGEVDVLEAIASVRTRYPVDPDRISVRGFSMGGAACWQFAVHYSDRWFAANPGAGFSETPRFLKVFQQESLKPTWYEQKLWHLYDCTDYPENLAQCPTVAYSGELDSQKQAADVMAESLDKVGIELLHVIGPKTKHAYHPEAKREVERRLASLAEAGRVRVPNEVRFTTYTLKYNTMNWVTIDAMGEHWERAHVRARIFGRGTIGIETENVTALTLSFPPGFAPFPIGTSVSVESKNGAVAEAGKVLSDKSFTSSLVLSKDALKLAPAKNDSLRKRHGSQGPIDDAFMDSFVHVRPTGRSDHPLLQSWVEKEMPRAIEHWRRHFRGEARVKDDVKINDDDIASSNLVVWGDATSNAIMRKIIDRMPIGWDQKQIKVGDRLFDAGKHALILIYPNPLNPDKYVVFNSGFTFRDYDYLNNARQVPKLPDWALIDLNTPPDARYPGKVVAADFFGEKWELRSPR